MAMVASVHCTVRGVPRRFVALRVAFVVTWRHARLRALQGVRDAGGLSHGFVTSGFSLNSIPSARSAST